MTLNEKNPKIKKALEKFVNLKALKLQLDLNINCTSTFDCSDMSKFLGSMKKLVQLHLLFNSLVFSEYANILKEVQKLKNLKQLSIIQTCKGAVSTFSSFAFGLISKTIQTLKNLESIDINLGPFFQSAKEMPVLLQSLTNHPNLKRVLLTLVFCPDEIDSYQFDQDFYGDILSLLQSLDRFHLTLANIRTDIQDETIKMFKDSQKNHTYLTINPIVRFENNFIHEHQVLDLFTNTPSFTKL